MDLVKFGFGKWNCSFNQIKTITNFDSKANHINYLNYEIDTQTLGISKSFNIESDFQKMTNIYNKDLSWE